MEGIELSRIVAGQDHSPVVYFLRVGDRVKIGTTTNLSRRTADLSLSLRDVAKVVPGGRGVEQGMHARWSIYRVDENREWFYVRGSLTSFLRGTADRRRAAEQHRRRSRPLMAAGPVDGAVSLSEASADRGAGIVRLRHDALRQAKRRDPEFPAPAGKRGNAIVYRPVDLQRWEQNRPSAQSAVTTVGPLPKAADRGNEVDEVDRMEATARA